MGLPAEIRELIYDALLVDPIRDEFRRVCTVDASGNDSWSRVVGSLPTMTSPRPTVHTHASNPQSASSTTATYRHLPEPTGLFT
jgi:hypothetical protein